ncbi:hypothetical protein J1605_022958 [Eschrichtius robustus]|uniref:Uncharacterized protein n=1 Tax=Eschrichtius robustus TaxID=9764 RepID=A0AB34H5F1_ESCRO|nr:hypothetical protein J1605_022958 [Eschrichtius robustus]
MSRSSAPLAPGRLSVTKPPSISPSVSSPLHPLTCRRLQQRGLQSARFPDLRFPLEANKEAGDVGLGRAPNSPRGALSRSLGGPNLVPRSRAAPASGRPGLCPPPAARGSERGRRRLLLPPEFPEAGNFARDRRP